jgi:hypothetical protein
VVGRANGPCCVVKEKTSTSSGFTDLAISSSAVHNIYAETWCMRSNIAFTCGFLIMVSLILILYDSHRYSKFSLNSLPFLYINIKYQHRGYRLNQILLTNCAMQLELSSKVSSTIIAYSPLATVVFSWRTNGSSTILNQLDAGSIILRDMKSMTVPSFPLRV